MKHLYLLTLRVVLTVVIFQIFSTNFYAQTCPNSGTPGSRAFDTTIVFPAGTTSIQAKFPQFDPIQGQVTCMRLCVTMGGVVSLLSFENNDISNSNTYTATYNRLDNLTGPGIPGSINNSISRPYSFPLAPSDNAGVPNGSGPDYGAILNDTITRQVCHTINTATDLTPFYGTDSVTYDYNMFGGLNIGSSPNATINVSSSGFVRFRFEYCTCPATPLPININQFTAEKISADKAELKWSDFAQPGANYRYEAQVSKNPHNSFSNIGTFDVDKNNSEDYRTVYQTANTESGNFYFRIRQVYTNGYVRYSEVRKVTLESSGAPKFSVYPNPSKGIVGIKFDNNSTGHYNVQIFNTQGQLIFTKDLISTGNANVSVTTMKDQGAYMIRVIDTKTKKSCVNQILIK